MLMLISLSWQPRARRKYIDPPDGMLRDIEAKRHKPLSTAKTAVFAAPTVVLHGWALKCGFARRRGDAEKKKGFGTQGRRAAERSLGAAGPLTDSTLRHTQRRRRKRLRRKRYISAALRDPEKPQKYSRKA
jgi:hypothetical protein